MKGESLESILSREKRYNNAFQELENFCITRGDLSNINEISEIDDSNLINKIEMYLAYSATLMTFKSSVPRLMGAFDGIRHQKIKFIDSKTMDYLSDSKTMFGIGYQNAFDQEPVVKKYISNNPNDVTALDINLKFSHVFNNSRYVMNLTTDFIFKTKILLGKRTKILELSNSQSEALYDINVLLLEVMKQLRIKVENRYLDFNDYSMIDAEKEKAGLN